MEGGQPEKASRTRPARTTGGVSVSVPAPDLHLRRPDAWPAFLTLSEAAAVLRVSRSTAYEMAQSGALPVVKFAGRSLRVPRGALAHLAGEPPVSTATGQVPDQQEPAAGGIKGPAAAESP